MARPLQEDTQHMILSQDMCTSPVANRFLKEDKENHPGINTIVLGKRTRDPLPRSTSDPSPPIAAWTSPNDEITLKRSAFAEEDVFAASPIRRFDKDNIDVHNLPSWFSCKGSATPYESPGFVLRSRVMCQSFTGNDTSPCASPPRSMMQTSTPSRTGVRRSYSVQFPPNFCDFFAPRMRTSDAQEREEEQENEQNEEENNENDQNDHHEEERHMGPCRVISPQTAHVRQTLRLPTIRHKDHSINVVTAETVASLVRGEYAHIIDRHYIVDCRFPFEHEGGHIRNAMNWFRPEDVENFFFTDTSRRGAVIIFHCEFSANRAPKMYRHLRNLDRTAHLHCYPNLYYPEIYLLESGYKAFFTHYRELCTPVQYVPMIDNRFGDELRENKKTLDRSWRRSRTLSEALKKTVSDQIPSREPLGEL